MAFKIGIAGFGVVGQQRANCIRANPAFELTAICDQRPEMRLIAGGLGIKVLDSFESLLKQELDALFVCTSNDVIAEFTLKGLQRGLHVFAEKPPARSVQEFQPILHFAQSHRDQVFAIGFNHRWHESVQKAKAVVDSGQLGYPLNFRAVYGKSKLITFNQTDWRTKREVAGGGILLDQGIHMVDLIRYMLGEFDVVSSLVSNDFWGFDVEDNVFVILHSRNRKLAGSLHSSATQWSHKFSLSIYFERGALKLEGILSTSKSYGDETLSILTSNSVPFMKEQEWLVEKYQDDVSWQREVDDFASLLIGSQGYSMVSAEEANETLTLVQRIYCADMSWKIRYGIKSPEDTINR